MVKTLTQFISKPFFISAVLCAVLFYSGLVKIKDLKPFVSLTEINGINEIYCIISSSPVKTSNGKYYSAKAIIKACKSKKNVLSSANGTISILIPSEMVEAYYPGKLYSPLKNKKSALYEKGGNYILKGNFSNQIFIVNDLIDSFWNTELRGKFNYFRAICRLNFKRIMYAWGESGGLLLAILCGSREYTNDSIKEAFKNAGLSHILALSGMHLSMFSGIAVFLGKKIKRKKLTFIIRILVLFLFVWFAGITPSLLRALISSLLIIIYSMFSSEEPDMLIILCFTFLLQCILTPQDIKNAAFMLSYGALCGILISGKFFLYLYSKFLPLSLAASLSSSTGAQILTAPISLKLFGSFSPIGIIATTFVSPLVTVFIYSGLVLMIITFIFPDFRNFAGIILDLIYKSISWIVSLFAYVPAFKLM